MFIAFVWLIVCFFGNVAMGGSVVGVSTSLTAGIDEDDTIINVGSTEGFPVPGVIVIGEERIAYTVTTATTFTQGVFGGDITSPMIRGAEETTAVAHSVGARVRSVEGGMMNTTASYNIAVIADASGLWAAATIGLAVLRLIGSFLLLPISFLGTDLAIIGVIWWVLMAGMLISFGLALAGGRRV